MTPATASADPADGSQGPGSTRSPHVRWAALLSAPVAGFIHDIAGATAQLRFCFARFAEATGAPREMPAGRPRVGRPDSVGRLGRSSLAAERVTEGVLLSLLAVRRWRVRDDRPKLLRATPLG